MFREVDHFEGSLTSLQEKKETENTVREGIRKMGYLTSMVFRSFS